MAIFTRFGSPVTVVAHCEDHNGAHVRFEDGSVRSLALNDLRADGGFAEIEHATTEIAQCAESCGNPETGFDRS